MNGAEVLLRTLVANGIEVCFSNPGTSEMQFVAALDRVPGLRSILCLFEGVCSGAADGYARMLRRPAATLLHLGPGLANGLANFHNARKARSPILSIVGEHSTAHLRFNAPLTADIQAFARPVSDDVFLVPDPQSIGSVAARAVAAARRHPGGIATLIVPADFSWSDAGFPDDCATVVKPTRPAAQAVTEAARLLREQGSNGGLLLSGGALLGKGLGAAERIARATGARVFADRNAARTTSGRGIFQPVRIPYFPEPAEAALAGVRSLVLVESEEPVSFFGYPGRRSTLAPVDCTLLVLATPAQDGTEALKSLSEELSAGPNAAVQRAVSVPELPPTQALSPNTAGQVLGALLPEGAIVSEEAISAAEAVWQWLIRAAPHDYLPITGGSIGQGLPVAVGAAVACPDRKVIALEADGSAMYTLQALWTMAREKLDVVTVIFANRRYRILDVEMKRTGAQGFGPIAETMIDIGNPDLDFVRLAEGMGVPASRAFDTAQLADRFASALKERGPRLIEAVIDGR